MVIFNSYVKLPEGIHPSQGELLFGPFETLELRAVSKMTSNLGLFSWGSVAPKSYHTHTLESNHPIVALKLVPQAIQSHSEVMIIKHDQSPFESFPNDKS